MTHSGGLVARAALAALAALALLLGAGVITPAPAAAAPSLGGFSARALDEQGQPTAQTFFEVTRNAGSKYVGRLQITNQTKEPIRLRVYGVDGLTGNTSGTVYGNRTDAKTGVGTWITPAKDTVRVDGESSEELRFTVRIPDGVRPGDHVGAVAMESADAAEQSKGQFAVKQIIRVAVAVQIRIRGAAERALEVTKLDIEALGGTQIPAVTVGLKNTGRLLCKPKLAVTLSSDGQEVGTVNRDLDTILPEKEIPFPLPWPNPLGAGTYEAVAKTSGCGTPAQRTGTVTIAEPLSGSTGAPGPNIAPESDDGIPWWVFLIGGLFVFFALLGGWLLGRRGRKDDDDNDHDAGPAKLIPLD